MKSQMSGFVLLVICLASLALVMQCGRTRRRASKGKPHSNGARDNATDAGSALVQARIRDSQSPMTLHE